VRRRYRWIEADIKPGREWLNMLAVEVQGLTKNYRDVWRQTQALADVSVRVERSVIFGLLGRDGAGKTTLVKILLGVVRPSAGDIRVLGQSPNDAKTRKRIGYLPEQMRLPAYLKAESFLR
jgi:ABC-2 type transport system ATP-binding protein